MKDLPKTQNHSLEIKVNGSEKLGRDSKPLSTLVNLMQELSNLQAQLNQSEQERLSLERRLHAEWQPLIDQIIKIKVETFRILGKHLKSGGMNRKDCKNLELALLDFALSLESDFGVDLEAERRDFFLESIPLEDFNADDIEDGEEIGTPHSYRESDFQQNNFKDSEQPKIQPTEVRTNSISDIRAVYLLLARALHPDKERDPNRQKEKTEWMQKVTEAFANKNLVELLNILTQNPLNAIGPYLSQAPIKTLIGFSKRLRRDLEEMKIKVASFSQSLDPLSASFFKNGKVNEVAFSIELSKLRKEVKFVKQRREMYATSRGREGLCQALRNHAWHELM